MDYDYCPKCDLGPLEEGEFRVGNKLYRYEYCADCRWQGPIVGYRVIRCESGTAYKIDPTVVLPDVALYGTIRGRLELPAGASDSRSAGYSQSAQPQVTAPCPQCGTAIRQCVQPTEDLSGYYVSWHCDCCDFRSEATKIPGPGLLTHSEDYKWISWKGQGYELTENQAAIVKKLHQSSCTGAPDVHQNELLREIGRPSSRIKDSFRSANRRLWGTLIIHASGARRGTLRLNL